MLQKQYCVPKNFNVQMLVGDRFKARCLNIINYMALSLRRRDTSSGYINIESNVLKVLATNNYSFYLKFLERSGVIQINHHFCNNELSAKGRFSKSYRFKPFYSCGYKVIEEVGFESNRKVLDKTDKTDAVCVQLAQSCCQLTLDYEALGEESHDVKEEAGELATQLQLRCANAKRGKKVNRIYHRINTASKEVRKLLRLHGIPLLEFDMRSAHPVLALCLYLDPNCIEAQKYKQLLNADIYSVYGVNRGDAKKLLRKFFYSKKHGIRKTGYSCNPVSNYYRAHFPVLFESIVSSTELAVRFQNLESYLFNDFLVPRARELALFYVSIHDGFMCAAPEAAETLSYLIREECYRSFKYKPDIIEKTALQSAILA